MKILVSLTLATLAVATTLDTKPLTNSLIVYNSNMGLVHEERKLALDKKDKSIIYRGVASSIDTESINVTLPKGVKLYSQQYRYDKLTRSKLLEAHIGKKISVEGKKVTLLSHTGNECIVKTANHKIISVDAKDVVFSSIPERLLTKPSLVWNIQTSRSVNAKMKLDYVIKNISWSSNYILNLHQNRADLSGWISVKNNAGKAFENTSLYVLAGDINRVTNTKPRPSAMYMKRAMVAESDSVKEVAYEGYHLYTIPFKVNLKNKETTQIKFLTKNSLFIQREYVAHLTNPLYLQGEIKSDVVQYIGLKGLDVALPKGVVRTYSKLDQTSILLGESSISHTPKDTPLRLKLGKNFDVKVTQTLKKRNNYKKYMNATIHYAVKNSSDREKLIQVQIPFRQSDTSVVQTKEKYSIEKGNLVTFKLRVKANTTREFDVYFESKK